MHIQRPTPRLVEEEEGEMDEELDWLCDISYDDYDDDDAELGTRIRLRSQL